MTHMAYVEMILLLMVALVCFVALALAVALSPVPHRQATHAGRPHTPGPPARPWSHAVPVAPVPAVRVAARRRGASRCSHQTVDWNRLMDAPGPRVPGHDDRGRAVTPAD